jgi:hypothetical protein
VFAFFRIARGLDELFIGYLDGGTWRKLVKEREAGWEQGR